MSDLTTDFATARWRDPGWLDRAAGWSTDRLAEHGHTVTAAHEHTHVRPWSTVLRLQTAGDVFWFKDNAIGTAHEGPLIQALAR